MIRNYLISYLYFIGIVIIGALIISILSYFDIMNNSVINIFKIITLSLATLISSYLLGKKATDRAYIYGIKFASIIFGVLLISNLIFIHSKISLIYFLSLFILFISSFIGSSVGINRKEKKA